MPGNLSWNFAPDRDYGTDWRSYFHQYTHDLHERLHRDDGDGEPKVVIKKNYESVLIQPAVQVSRADLPKQAREVADLLSERKLMIRHSQTRQVGTVFASGAKAGEKRPDKVLDHYSIATVDGEEPVLVAYWIEPAVLDFADFGWLDGTRRRVTLVTELKQLIKGVNNADGDND